MLTNTVNKIKSWVEKWQHRLQGHMVITIVPGNGSKPHSHWISAVYTSDGGKMFADLENGESFPLYPEISDYTITGA